MISKSNEIEFRFNFLSYAAKRQFVVGRGYEILGRRSHFLEFRFLYLY